MISYTWDQHRDEALRLCVGLIILSTDSSTMWKEIIVLPLVTIISWEAYVLCRYQIYSSIKLSAYDRLRTFITINVSDNMNQQYWNAGIQYHFFISLWGNRVAAHMSSWYDHVLFECINSPRRLQRVINPTMRWVSIPYNRT